MQLMFSALRRILNESKHVIVLITKLYIAILYILFVTVSKINILSVSSSTEKCNQHSSLLLSFQLSKSMQHLQPTVYCCHLAPRCFNVSKSVT
jgi:hypothetical protein